MHGVLLGLARLTEESMAALYAAMAETLPEGHLGRDAFQRLAEEERQHAAEVQVLAARIQDANLPPALVERIILRQLGFLRETVALLTTVRERGVSGEIVHNLCVLEGRLAESLFSYLELQNPGGHAASVRRMAEDSKRHAERLADLVGMF